eukprot:gene8092-10961_t
MNTTIGSIMPPRHVFSFPLLKAEEITKCLNELGINAAVDDVLNPDKNKESCRRILELLTEICTGESVDELAQPAFAGLSVLNYPELHEESIPQYNLFIACTKMMEMCEVQDFTIKDFITPVPNRFRRHLSGIINFAKFREERLVLLSQLSATREGLLDQWNQQKEKHSNLANRLSLLREQTAEESALISKLESESKEIAQNIEQMNNQQIEMRDNAAELKARSNELKEKIISGSKEYEELLEMKVKLTSQIVSSPEKFRKQIIEVGQNLQTEQKDAKIAEKKVRDLTAWLCNVEESQNDVTLALEFMQELRADVDRQKALTLELASQKQTTSSNRLALSELDQNVNQLIRHSTRAEEKLQNLRKQTTRRGDETHSTIDQLHQQLIDAEAFRMQLRGKAERVSAEVVRVEKEVDAENIAFDQEIEEIKASYQKLEKVVCNYLQGFQKALVSTENDKIFNSV